MTDNTENLAGDPGRYHEPTQHGLADLLGVSASDRDEIRALKSRVERIERRVELAE